MVFCSGCASILPGHDPVVVNAERTVKISFDTFDTFLKLEYDNREQLKKISPDILKAADNIRNNAPKWLETANTTIRAYKKHRDLENKFNLNTAMAVLQNALNEAQKYIALSRASTP
jgi:hypothetical protein